MVRLYFILIRLSWKHCVSSRHRSSRETNSMASLWWRNSPNRVIWGTLNRNREDMIVELKRNIDLFHMVQVDRISIKAETSRRYHAEGLLWTRYYLGCFTYAMSLNFLNELLKLPSLSPFHRWESWGLNSSIVTHLDLRYESVLILMAI